MKIGLFGGTFDPPHIAHIIMAVWVREEFKLDRIIFIPAYLQPLKLKRTITSFELREKMVSLAIENEENFELSRIEFKKGGVSYTVHLLAAM
ncbi:MAG: nicotinate-nicotinamide nucleotide adenylyltransferase, partial [bacterium]